MLLLSIIAAIELKINAVELDVVEAFVRNEKDFPIAFLLPNTPFSGMKEDTLQVLQNETRVKFVGQLVKWDFSNVKTISKIMQAGEIWRQKVEVSKLYHTYIGAADIKLSFPYRECNIKDNKVTSCETSSVNLQSTVSISLDVKTHQRHKGVVPDYSTKKCYFMKWIHAKYAIRKFHQIQVRAISDLQNGPSTSFHKYFGTANTTEVLKTFQKTKNYKFNVECNNPDCNTMQGTVAFVYPDQPTIFVCPLFHAATYTGYNSKPGVLVHESTHFLATSYTTDIASGVLETSKLGTDDPELAITNADNYEYFAESLFYNLPN